MNLLREELNTRIATALEGCATAVEQAAPGRWSFAVSTRSSLRASAWRDADWLLLDAPGGSQLSDWTSRSIELLERTPRLPGVVKYAATEDLTLRVRAELPLLDDLDLSRRLSRCLAGFASATAAEGKPDVPAGDAVSLDLERLCTETGWAFTPREPGRLMVPLDARRAFVQAALELLPERGVMVSVPLVAAGICLATPCEQAVALLALRAAGAVRMVRAAATPGDGARFEVQLGADPIPAEVVCALASLSLAWQLAGREAEVLARDATVAAQYVESVQPLTERQAGSMQ